MGGACDNPIFSLVVEFLNLCLIAGLGAFLNAVLCRIWGEAGEDLAPADRSMTAQEPMTRRAA